ncbi:MAG TPA: hypothetical protein VIM73_20445 [Polyangiaceae bacterium]
MRSVRSALLAVVLLGCQEEEPERPPPLPPCVGATCVPRGGVAPPSSSGGSGEGAFGGADAGGDAGAGGANDSLEGSVLEFVDDQFESSVTFTGTATLVAEGARGGTTTASWDGADPFQLSGFEQEQGLTWVLVSPAPNRGVLPTLHPVPTGNVRRADLGLVRTDNLDLILLLLTVPLERLPERAQLVLRFTDPESTTGGAEGVRVVSSDAEFISYAVEGTWSDLETATDQSGLVLLGNLSAPPFPGSTKRLSLAGALTGTLEVRVAAGAVSVVEVAPPR